MMAYSGIPTLGFIEPRIENDLTLLVQSKLRQRALGIEGNCVMAVADIPSFSPANDLKVAYLHRVPSYLHDL